MTPRRFGTKLTRMRRGFLRTAAALLLLLAPLRVRAASDDSDSPDPHRMFREGNVELDAGVGLGVFDSKDYFILLAGGGYYLRDGLSVGATAEAWTGPEPHLYDVSPAVRYIFLDVPWHFQPYAGAFYRRTVYDHDYTPIDSSGVRGGLVFPLTPRAYLTGGLVYEHYFGCDKSVYTSCDQVYPEIGLAFAF